VGGVADAMLSQQELRCWTVSTAKRSVLHGVCDLCDVVCMCCAGGAVSCTCNPCIVPHHRGIDD